MKSVYIYQQDTISFWEELTKIEIKNFSTINILQKNIDSLEKDLFKITKDLNTIFPYIFRWHIYGHYPENKLQQYKILKEVKKQILSVGCYRISTDNIILAKPIHTIFPIFNLSPYHSILIFLKDTIECKTILKSLAPLENKISVLNVNQVLSEMPALLIARVFEDDTHAVIQFIGKSNDIQQIQTILDNYNILEVKEQDIATYINH